MKVDRVILATNNNPTYYHFWNPLSKVYTEKFGIRPTLMFVGTKEELGECNLSNEYGLINLIEPHPNYHIPFQTTWALFYGAGIYTDSTSIIMGIDQVILSPMFTETLIKDIPDNAYVQCISDAYLPHHWTKEGSASPSSYHIAKGSIFKEVFGFEKDFKDEIEKIVNSGVKAFWEDTAGRWGIDETYSSYKLRQWNGNKVSLEKFGLLCERRIECERHKETPYDIQKLQQGWYSESHMCRPFTNHTEYLTNLFNNIPCYTQQP